MIKSLFSSCSSFNPGHPDMATPRFAIRQPIYLNSCCNSAP
jgi:hypothetical protein